MADQVVFEGRWNAGARPPARNGRSLVIVFCGVILLIMGELVFQFGIAPNMRIESIVFDNTVPVPREQLLVAAGLHGKPYYFKLNLEEIKNGLEGLPPVKSAFVQKVFPDSLRIVTRGREPLATAFAETEGGILPLAFDEEGVVFLSGKDVPEQGLPVFSGLRFEGPQHGTRLPAMLKPFLQDLHKLRKSSPALFSAFSEMRVVPRGAEHFEIILYPVYYRVPVRIEGELEAERCKVILIVLDALLRDGTLDKMAEIDFRTNDIIYRLKEG
ncbi:MAG: FtsQ-type POTRA domain-containing protein [Spirochaetales bacterium]|jgi:cell division protein FtsQ|nr:FtsQ-type POTRA domain-containing protein [Spirochaetales bacterium]